MRIRPRKKEKRKHDLDQEKVILVFFYKFSPLLVLLYVCMNVHMCSYVHKVDVCKD